MKKRAGQGHFFLSHIQPLVGENIAKKGGKKGKKVCHLPWKEKIVKVVLSEVGQGPVSDLSISTPPGAPKRLSFLAIILKCRIPLYIFFFCVCGGEGRVGVGGMTKNTVLVVSKRWVMNTWTTWSLGQ